MNDDYDFWTETPRANPAQAAPALTVKTIRDLEPLDAQFGVAAPRTVPMALQDALFGQPEATEAEIDAYGGDPARVPPLRTYAILDAAKVTNLAEMLDASELPHRCLFKGDAYDELKDVAPWIVRLDDSDAFTRNLFTSSDAPWHLWDHKPGIYIRSRGTLEDLWKHFRKFTKVKDEAGQWFYWRFWEGGGLLELLRLWQETPHKTGAFVGGDQFSLLRSLVCLDERTSSAVDVRFPATMAPIGKNTAFNLDKADRHVLSNWRAIRFDQDLIAEMKADHRQFAALTDNQTSVWLQSVIEASERVGIRLEAAITDFAHAACLLGADPTTHGETAHLLRDQTLHQKDRARLARQAAEQHSRVRG